MTPSQRGQVTKAAHRAGLTWEKGTDPNGTQKFGIIADVRPKDGKLLVAVCDKELFAALQSVMERRDPS
jgi:hypothetical protein